MIKDFYKTITKPKVALGFMLLGVLHLAGIEFGLYRTTNWYDSPMHFLGGVLLAIFIYNWPGFAERFTTNKQKLVAILVFVFAVGVAWEIFEIAFDAYFDFMLRRRSLAEYKLDTIKDLILDVVGGYTVYYFKYKKARV